jgi:hypothetical protein
MRREGLAGMRWCPLREWPWVEGSWRELGVGADGACHGAGPHNSSTCVRLPGIL